jgi:predicted DNA-binding transcriptional regulator YafY
MKDRNQVIRRLLIAQRLLQTSRPTLPQLARAMKCSERTARRYVESLEDACIPVRRHGPHYRIESRA